MKENQIRTSLTIPRKFWRKLKVIASDRGVSTNTLVIEALKKQYHNAEVTVS